MKKFWLIPVLLSGLDAETIKSISYEGLSLISPESANDIAELKVGQNLTTKGSNKAILNLYKQGYFNDISISQTNGHVKISLKEKKIIAKLDVQGVVTNDKKAILSILDIKKGQVLDELNIKRSKERVRQFYEARSYFDTVVDIQELKVEGSPNSVNVVFTVNRGERITIEKVNLVGAKKLKYRHIEPVVENKEREFAGWLWGRNDGRAKIFELPNDGNKITDEYYRRGYLDARVSTPFLATHFDNYKAQVFYYIDEGERYKVETVEIDAPDSLELNKYRILNGYTIFGFGGFMLEGGDWMNNKWMQDDMAKLKNIVADKGYAYAKVVPDVKQDREKKTVKITYKVIPGEKVKIRNLIVSGNDRTLDRIVRREMYLTEDSTYNLSDLVDSRNALRRTGYFSEVSVNERRVSENEMDLQVDITESPTGSISGGVGYGSGDGLLINAGVSEMNLFGTGYKASLNADKSDTALTGSLGLTNPRLFDSQFSLGGSVYAREYDYTSYFERSYGFDISLGRGLGRYVNTYLTYKLEQSDIKYESDFYEKIGYLVGKKLKSSGIFGIGFNNTDDYYLARRGVIMGTSFEYAGLGGDVKFLKNRTNFAWYFGWKDIVGWDLIMRLKANFGYIWSNDPFQDEYYGENGGINEEFAKKHKRTLPINEKFYLGGVTSLRGYDSRTVSPRYQDNTDYTTGGRIMASGSFELSFPLVDRIKLRGMAFFDYGVIGDRKINEFERYSYGAGIEWLTVIGPLQIIYANPIGAKGGDSTSHFEFNIGRRF